MLVQRKEDGLWFCGKGVSRAELDEYMASVPLNPKAENGDADLGSLVTQASNSVRYQVVAINDDERTYTVKLAGTPCSTVERVLKVDGEVWPWSATRFV